ncbi:MAG: cell division protein FtsQ/DivIB, partial [Gammaproteobacteria bacterium]
GALPGDLPQLQGPAVNAPQMLARCRAMEDTLAPLGLTVARLSLDRRRSWRALLDNGVQLALGKERPLQRVARFARYYQRVAAGREQDVEVFDLRYANGFVVRWRTDGAPVPGGFPS